MAVTKIIAICGLLSTSVVANNNPALDELDSPRQINTLTIQQLESTVRNRPKKTLDYAKTLIKETNQDLQTFQYIDLLNIIAYAEYLDGNFVDSLEHAKQAEKLADEHKYHKSLARAFIIQGNLLQGIGLYRNAVSTYQKAVAIYTEYNYLDLLSRALTNIGNTYYSAKQYEAANKFYLNSLDSSTKPIEFASNYLGIGNVLGQQNNPNKAIYNFEQALAYYRDAQDVLGTELALTGLASQFITLKKYEKAMSILSTAIESAKQGNRHFRVLNMELQLAETKSLQGNNSDAINDSTRVLKQGKRLGNTRIQSTAQRFLHGIYKRSQNYYQALLSIEAAEKLEQLADLEQTEYQLTALQSILDLELKNQRISQLSSANQLQQLKMEQQRTLNVAIIVGLLFIFTALAWLFYRHYQRKLLLRQLAINSRLEELNTLKTQLLANTSHELRTPLNGISGMSQLLLDNPEEPLTHEQSEMVEVIEQSSTRLLRLIEDLLDLSQLQAKRMTVKLEKVDLNKVSEKVVSSLKHLAIQKGLKIHISFTPSHLSVLADEKRLEQILVNLIGNSIKFSEAGSITLKASIIDQDVELRVIDQGVGIPADKVKNIFDPFTQVDSAATRKQQGSGLGLSITKELVLLHDSHLNVKSNVGVGTEFFFKLTAAEKYSATI